MHHYTNEIMFKKYLIVFTIFALLSTSCITRKKTIVTEDGKPITTENGKPIKTE